MISTKTKKTTSVTEAISWSFIAEISAKMVVPLINMVLARILAPQAFGIIATVNIVVSFAETFSTAGLQRYLVQHEYQSEDELHRCASVAFWTNLAISIILWIFIAIFKDSLAHALGNDGYGIALCVACISLPLSSFSSVQEALFQRRLEYRILFYRRIAVCLTPLLVTIPAAVAGLGYWSLIIGTIAGNLVKAFLLTIKSDWKPNIFYDFSLLTKMLSFGVWSMSESFLLWASANIDIIIISNALGDYYTGLYKTSQSLVTGILSIITGTTTGILFVSLSRNQNNKRKFEDTLYKFQKYVAVLVLPIGVTKFCFSNLITYMLLGPKWMEASTFIGIWGLCTSMVCVWGTFIREAYRAIGKPKISFFAQLLHLIFVIPVCLYGVSAGFSTLIYVRSLAYLQIIIVHMVFMKLFLKTSPLNMFISIKAPILGSLLMILEGEFLCSFFKNYFAQFCCVIICIASYLMFLSIFSDYRKMFIDVKIRTKKIIVNQTPQSS